MHKLIILKLLNKKPSLEGFLYERLIIFDVIRIFAVLLVVLVHLLQKYAHPLGRQFGVEGIYYVTIGGVGVSLMIMLSGMVLEYNYGNKNINYIKFLYKRFKRIYPTYWLSIIITIFLFGTVRLPKNFADYMLDLSGFLSITGRPWSEYILPTGWFIGVIVSLYFFYPFISRYVKEFPVSSIFLLFMISLISRYVSGKYFNGYRPLDWFAPNRFFEFGIGIWIVNQKCFDVLRKFNDNINKSVRSAVIYASNLSFPVYMIHWSVQRIDLITNLKIIIFLPLFLLITLMMSQIIYSFDKGISRFL